MTWLKKQWNFTNKTRWKGQMIVRSRKNPVCISVNSVFMVLGCTNKIPSKVTYLVEQPEYHNLLLGIIINRCVATTKARAVPIIIINTTKQNIWLWQPLLAAELFTAEYHQIEHRANMERKRYDINISFLPVAPNTIRVQSEQVEATSSDISPPNSTNKPAFGPKLNMQAANFYFETEGQC